MITIACVLRKGGDYNWQHFIKLADDIEKNITAPHRIACLTDELETIMSFRQSRVIWPMKLLHDWPGWWSKIEVFDLPPPVLYLDLDTVITGNIDPLANWVTDQCDGLMMLRGFYKGDKCSGIMGWRQDMRFLYRRFKNHFANKAEFVKRPNAINMVVNRKRYRGDQEWLAMATPKENIPVTFVQDVFPGVYSYKVHVKESGIPDDARVICFHGKPRPHEVELELGGRV